LRTSRSGGQRSAADRAKRFQEAVHEKAEEYRERVRTLETKLADTEVALADSVAKCDELQAQLEQLRRVKLGEEPETKKAKAGPKPVKKAVPA
jgi:chromosome segregation ATPase